MSLAIVKKIPVGMLETNCYLVYDEDRKIGVCIDPGGDANTLIEWIRSKGITIEGILLTHGHFDHIVALQKMKEYTKAPVYISKNEKSVLLKPEENLSSQFGSALSFQADHYLEDKELIMVGNVSFQTIETPGHTKGSVCYYVETDHILFSGDTLFLNSVGRTDLPTGNIEKIYDSIKERLFVLPEETKVYPGHGDVTSIGYEKKSNMII